MAYTKPKRITLLMPEHHHADDAQWIDRNLSMLGDASRAQICEAYSSVFIQAYNSEPLPHKKDGSARFKANVRLLTYIKKRFAVFNK